MEKIIRGVKLKGEEYKLRAFTDDLVFILEEPTESVNKLLDILQNYDEVAGMKVNKDENDFQKHDKNMTNGDFTDENAI